MDHVLTEGTKMVVENDNYTFQNIDEPAMAETTIVANPFPDPVLESAKSLLDSMSTSSAKIAKMLKPVSSLVKNNVPTTGIIPGVAQKNFGYRRKTMGQKTDRFNSNNWKPTASPQIHIPDVNLKTTVASSEITLTLEPVPCGNSLHSIPYYARNRSISEFTFRPATSEIVEIYHDKVILEWHHKHVQKLLRLGPTSKPKTSNFKAGNGLKPHLPGLGKQSAGTAFQAGLKRKYFEISDRYYQYLNKPKRARHDSFQTIFRSHILLNHVKSVHSAAVDHQTLYPRKFLSWPSGKVVMPGYYPQRYFDKNNRRTHLKRKRTWSLYRVPKPRPHPVHRVPNNKHTYSAIMKKLMNKKLASEDRLKWNPVSKKFHVAPGQHNSAKISNSKQWFQFPSSASRKNPVQSYTIPTNSKVINNLKKKYSTVSTSIQSNWRTSFKTEPTRSVVVPPRVQHRIKDIRVIFKCKVVPNPISFESYQMYSNACIVFQIRRLISFKALKQGRLEKRVDDCNQRECIEANSGVLEEPKSILKVKLLSSSALISLSTETILSSWSSSLDKYSLGQSKNNVSPGKQINVVSKCWLHVCNGVHVDSVGIAYPDDDNVDVSKEVLYAWALDEPYNDAYSAARIVNSSKHPSDRSPDKNDVAHLRNDIPHCRDFPRLPKIQRLQTRLKCSPCNEVELRQRKTFVPEPGYCVRYRFGFCTFDCACGSGLGSVRNTECFFPSVLPFEHVIPVEEGKNALLPVARSEFMESSATVETAVHDSDNLENIYSLPILDKSVPCAVCEGAVNMPAKPTVEGFSGVNGNIVTSNCNKVIAPCNDTKDILTNENSSRNHQTSAMGMENTVDGTDFSHCDGHVSLLASGERLAHEPLFNGNHCLYNAAKSLLSRMAIAEYNITRRSNYMNDKHSSWTPRACETVCNRYSEPSTRSSDNAGRHYCNPIGGNCFEVERKVIALGKHSISNATNRDSSNTETANRAVVARSEGMGNSLGKRKLLNGLLQIDDCSETSRYICDSGIATVTSGIQRGKGTAKLPKKELPSSSFDRLGRSYDAKKQHEPSKWMMLDSTYAVSGSEYQNVSDAVDDRDIDNRPTTLRSYASLKHSTDKTKPKIPDASTRYIRGDKLNTAKSRQFTLGKGNKSEATVNGRPEGNKFSVTRNSLTKRSDEVTNRFAGTNEFPDKGKTDFCSIESDQSKVSISRCDREPKKEPAVEGENQSDCETRSSRRLRSRAKCKKRGRYETDYVSDIPKASKKPKKIYPTNEYDNEDFWKFYSRCENTVYSKNLLLQYKYIKLLKSRGITYDCTPLTTQSCSGISSLTTLGKTRHVIPKNGILPLLEKYTKQRKAPPELPKVSDEHCAYCGRSFVGRVKEYKDHVARHGMPYQVLSAPRLPKKKKKNLKTVKKVDNSINARGSMTNAEAKEMLLANSQNQRFPLGGQQSHDLDSLRPLSCSSLITMGHRKQTARKSFSITSTLPKNVLIAALQCEMRAKTTKTKRALVSESTAVNLPLPEVLSKETLIENDVLVHDYLPKPSSARKTLTGLPITYNHLDRNFL